MKLDALTFKVASFLEHAYGDAGPQRKYDLGVARRIVEMVRAGGSGVGDEI